MARRKPIKAEDLQKVIKKERQEKAPAPVVLSPTRPNVVIKKDWEIEHAPILTETKEPILLAPSGEVDVVPSEITPDKLEKLRQVNLALWCLTSGFEVDHHRFNFDSRRYLLPLYLHDGQKLVLQKAAQMGATIWVLLKILHALLYGARGYMPDEDTGDFRVYPIKAGFFFPTEKGVAQLSKDRLTPLIASNQELLKSSLEGPAEQFRDNILLKQFGPSTLYMAHLSGSVSKDSTPMDILAFDEVRLLKAQDITQAEERVSASRLKGELKVSTAGHPGLDINAQFNGGKQYHWHTKCLCGKHPHEWVEMSEVFPDCIVDNGKEVYYRCPRCGAKINDTQNGCYVPHNPDGEYASFHVHQMISKFISAKEIWNAWHNTDNIKEFYNAKLGKPYVDEENVPITQEVIAACENADLEWDNPKDRYNCCMGVDQRSGELHVVIVRRNQHGKKQIVLVELIQSANPRFYKDGKMVTPFYFLGHLMARYDVDCCLIDGMPSINEAMDFARKFPGRVWIAFYGSIRDMIQWSDRGVGRKESAKTRRASEMTKFKWHAIMNRYSTLDFTLKQFTERRIMMPPLKKLRRSYKQPSGRFDAGPLGELFGYHLTRLCRTQVALKEETGEFRMDWINLGLDPHYAHAASYAIFALERKASNFNFIFV